MVDRFFDSLRESLEQIRKEGLYKEEHCLLSPQGAAIEVSGRRGEPVLNFCANNYLGLANHPLVVQAAREALDRYGFGMSSVRFICGTQDVHKELEERIASFVEMEDAILYSSCFDANGGVFEALLTEADAVISDALNHASIIDGIRLCKARRFRYKNRDMGDLERQLQEAQQARYRLIVTDGAFSMDGTIAPLDAIVELAARYDALVMVDDSHATGFIGERGKGSHEHCGVMGKIDIISGTLGKALGGASGGFIAARREITTWLRQRSRPYLFSNTLAPVIAATSLAVFDLVEKGASLRERLRSHTSYFRRSMAALGFAIPPGEHPIAPVMLGEARLAVEMARQLLEEGIYVIGFSYPVVPQGEARIRTQLSAAHTHDQVERAVAAFASVGRQLGVIR